MATISTDSDSAPSVPDTDDAVTDTNAARTAALDAAAKRPPYDASTLGDMRTRDLVPAMPTHLSAPGVNLGAYINTVHQIPILTPTQEQELAHRYYDDGDVEAARLLVMSHLRFVIHIARSYSGYGLPQADLIQEGNLGLMKAVKRFDPNKGVCLVSFAVHWIKAEIHEFVIRNWRIVKVATTKAHRKLFFNLRWAVRHLRCFGCLGCLVDCELQCISAAYFVSLLTKGMDIGARVGISGKHIKRLTSCDST